MTTNAILPNPEERPTVPVWPEAARALGIGRTTAYAAAQRGDLPGVMKIGGRFVVATATLRRHLGLDRIEVPPTS